MNKFLYCKYSNERDKKFSIYTEIREDENKIRYVEKIPIGEEARGHVALSLIHISEPTRQYS